MVAKENEQVYLAYVTFQKWDEDAREIGEALEAGIELDADAYDLFELKGLARNLGINSATTDVPEPGQTAFATSEPVANREHFEQGIDMYRTLHVEKHGGHYLQPEELLEVAGAMGIEFDGLRARAAPRLG